MTYYAVTGAWAVLCALGAQAVRQHYDVIVKKLSLRGALAGGKARTFFFVALAVCSVLPLALLSGLRYDVGTDYFYTYVPEFDKIASGAGLGVSRMEIGFWLLVKGIRLLGGGHVWMFLISSAVIVGFFAAGIYRLSPLPWYSLALFLLCEVFFISMNGVRQFMGMAIVFFGFSYLGVGNAKPCFWKWTLCVLAAASFHTSNLLFLPLFFLPYLTVNPIVPLFLVLLLSAFNRYLYSFGEWLVSFTPYRHYWGGEFQAGYPIYSERVVVYLFVLSVALMYWNQNGNAKNRLYRFSYYCSLGALLLCINHNMLPLTIRIGWAMEMCQLLLLPMAVVSEKRRLVRWGLLVVIALVFGQLCYTEIFVQGSHEVLPYQSVLFLANV